MELNSVIEKKLKLGNLFDFYGQLLTTKQQDVLNLYCVHDLSLGEISEDLSVSRQAIHDTIRKCEKILDDYENKLNLQEKYNLRRKLVQDITSNLDEATKSDTIDKDAISIIKAQLSECLE